MSEPQKLSERIREYGWLDNEDRLRVLADEVVALESRLAKARGLASEPCKTCDFKYPECDDNDENECPTKTMLKALGVSGGEP